MGEITGTWRTRMEAHAKALIAQQHAVILAIESSCDETAAAVVADGREVRSSVIASQIPLHAMYGGVVPEIASRKHVESVDPVVKEALSKANMTLGQVDAVAVTYGPGLVGALLVGVAYAKAIAYAEDKPLIPVNHIEGHVSANYIAHPDLKPPFVCLIASGGHSHIVRVNDYGSYTLLGQTMDDAAGEAFDKAARVLNLPYPGGPLLDRLSKEGNPLALPLPHVKISGRYDYSFSGLKTALINRVHAMRQRGEDIPAADIAASFQHAVVEMLSDKAVLAAVETGAKTVALAGGVALKSGLRAAMQEKCDRHHLKLVMPPPILCTDNAAMIGSAAFYRLMKGELADLDLNACPSLRLVYSFEHNYDKCCDILNQVAKNVIFVTIGPKQLSTGCG